MADYDCLDAPASVTSGAMVLPEPGSINGTTLNLPPTQLVINRGTNSGGGAAFAYWMSPDKPDPMGVYYAGSRNTIPWAQLIDIISVGTVIPTRWW